MENKREYHGWQKGKYMFPCDEVIRPGSTISISISMGEASELMRGNVQTEMDRMDIYHKLFLVARKDKLHSTPLMFSPDSKLRVLDLGTGTGIWSIDMAL
jgi:2-polyprenyl-3-methyl-5-hydroxy-6-metoxy-1,4-benzoquinol methylase